MIYGCQLNCVIKIRVVHRKKMYALLQAASASSKKIFWHSIVVCWFACCECFGLYCVNCMSHRWKHLFLEHVNSNFLFNILHCSIQKHSIFEISAVISDFEHKVQELSQGNRFEDHFDFKYVQNSIRRAISIDLMIWNFFSDTESSVFSSSQQKKTRFTQPAA